MRNFTILATLFLSLFACNTAMADTSFSGAISGDVVWAKANGPYIVNYVSIPAGASLTIQPGTIIKVADNSYPFIVDGTLTIGGAVGEQVVITSMKDDTVGGDSNGDGGATTPQAGDWREITFNPGSTENITNTKIAYGGASVYNSWTGGYFNFPLIDNKGGTLTLTNITLSKSGNNAFEQTTGTTTITNSMISDLSRGIMNYGGSLTIGNNTFTNLGDYGVSVYAATNFTNNGGNTGGRGIYMAYSITGNQTWAKDNIPYVANSISIPSSSSLTITPGAVVKVMSDALPFYVDGALAIGAPTATENAIVTSIKDDSIGGDTNADGSATTPQAGDWRKITMNAGSVVNVTHAIIKYGGATPYNYWTGGYFTFPLIENNGGVLTINNSQLAQSGYFGVEQFSGTTTISNSTLANISKWGVYNAQGYLNIASTTFDTMERGIEVSAGALELGGNIFTHISSYAASLEGSYIALTNHAGNTGSTGLFLSQTISGAQMLPKDGLVYIVNYFSVPVGSTLTILPGAIVKIPFNGSAFTIDGTLNIGSSASTEKAYITSVNDDVVGGDTNGDATSTIPNSGDWRTMTFNAGSSATIQNTVIRYGGASPYNSWTGGADWLPAIKNNGGTLTFDHITLTNNGNFGILQLAGTTTITNSEIAHTGRYGIWMTGGVLSANNSSIHDNATYGIYNGSTNIIDATNNWWGSATGPTHPSNPTGTGDKVSDNVNFANWMGSEPTAGCVINCNSNVLFLPGIESSRLYRPDYSGGTDQLWEPNTSSDVEDIYLDKDGKSLRDDIYTKDVIDEANTVFPRPNVYLSFLADLEKWKTDDKIIADYSVAPYDWRLSMDDVLNNGNKFQDGRIYYSGTNAATTTPFIIQELRRLAATSRTGKVTIVAHSNGGLVAKALINKLGADAGILVDKVVFVAVPQLGTPQAVGALLHGYDQGLPKDWLPAFLNPATARAFASTSPMAYQLLPSADYFHSEGIDTITPIATFGDGVATQPFVNSYGHAIGNYTELKNFLLGSEGRPTPTFSDIVNPSKLSSTLLTYGENLHQQIDDNWSPPSSIKIFQIAGFGNDTVSGINYWTGQTCAQKALGGVLCLAYAPTLEYTPMKVVDGDGTVVTTSALAMSTSSANVSRWWVNLGGYNAQLENDLALGFIDSKHANILEVQELRDFIKNNILKESATALPKFLSGSIPSNDSTKRLSFFLHSPLALSVHDSAGNEISESTSTITGGHFERFGEVQYISVFASTSPTLELDGLADGSFNLEVQESEGNTTIATTTFSAIPSSTSTKVTMNFIDGTIAHAGALNIDEDGNGTIDLSLLPKVGDTVTTPLPKSSLTVTADSKTIFFGGSIPSLSATLSGFINSDTASTSVTGSANCTSTATATSTVGIYPITCTIGTLSSSKYDFITFATGTVTILYKWSGFAQPINDVAYNPGQTPSVFKGGSTVPVKFQLKNASGMTVQAHTLPLWLTPQKGNSMSVSVDESIYSDPSSSGTTYKYDATSSQYIYNWSTKGLATGWWYKLSAKLDDGTTQSVTVGIR